MPDDAGGGAACCGEKCLEDKALSSLDSIRRSRDLGL